MRGRLFLTLLGAVVAALLAVVAAAPTPAPPDSSSSEEHDVVYDQRQNGSENLRVNLSDLTFVVVPGDGLSPLVTEALGMMAMGAYNKKDCEEGGRCKSAPATRSRLKLSSILQPLVNRANRRRRDQKPRQD